LVDPLSALDVQLLSSLNALGQASILNTSSALVHHPGPSADPRAPGTKLSCMPSVIYKTSSAYSWQCPSHRNEPATNVLSPRFRRSEPYQPQTLQVSPCSACVLSASSAVQSGRSSSLQCFPFSHDAALERDQSTHRQHAPAVTQLSHRAKAAPHESTAQRTT
jgi:hypothetical protein